ncbi:trehalose-phosphatase [Micromonospora sp. CPCC 205371]|nr:trehalose-phosphatase [Micromonospora sp. CPCC 205371]
MRPNDQGETRPSRPFTADQAWHHTATRPAETVLFFDFDGVLSPVEDDPNAAQPVPEVTAAVAGLAEHVRQISLVSARPVDFLRDRFPTMENVDFYGLYGLEHSRGHGETVTEPDALPWVPAMAELAERARVELPEGALVEYKRLSVALHYRTSPHLAHDVEAWGLAEAERLGLKVQGGRMVIELKPPVDRDKGMVIQDAVGDARIAWYFGDDVSDIKAFKALRGREAEDPGFFGVCVAVANPETGQEVAGAADLTIDSPHALGKFLASALQTLR